MLLYLASELESSTGETNPHYLIRGVCGCVYAEPEHKESASSGMCN